MAEIVNVSFVFIALDKPSTMIILQIRFIPTYCWQPSSTLMVLILSELLTLLVMLLYFIKDFKKMFNETFSNIFINPSCAAPLREQHHQAGLQQLPRDEVPQKTSF